VTLVCFTDLCIKSWNILKTTFCRCVQIWILTLFQNYEKNNCQPGKNYFKTHWSIMFSNQHSFVNTCYSTIRLLMTVYFLSPPKVYIFAASCVHFVICCVDFIIHIILWICSDLNGIFLRVFWEQRWMKCECRGVHADIYAIWRGRVRG